MNRKQFIQQNGATCKSWTWSWSFVNHSEKKVIFGVWSTNVVKKSVRQIIFSKNWEFDKVTRRRKNAFQESIEHLELIKNHGYKLYTFLMEYSEDKNGKPKIRSINEHLEEKQLAHNGIDWFAEPIRTISTALIPEEIQDDTEYLEGAVTNIQVNRYERDRKARDKCLEKFGYKCQVCEFDFYDFYGDLGKEFIHVHHITPISEIGREYSLNPIKDLIPVCPNCHAMIHRTKPAQTWQDLKVQLESIGSISKKE